MTSTRRAAERTSAASTEILAGSSSDRNIQYRGECIPGSGNDARRQTTGRKRLTSHRNRGRLARNPLGEAWNQPTRRGRALEDGAGKVSRQSRTVSKPGPAKSQLTSGAQTSCGSGHESFASTARGARSRKARRVLPYLYPPRYTAPLLQYLNPTDFLEVPRGSQILRAAR